jgi:ribonuclease HI
MIIYTDGSAINNGKKDAFGGIGIYIPKQDNVTNECLISYSLISTFKQNQKYNITVSNQIAELIASIIGIEKAIELNKNNDTIYVYTDSKYVIDCATTWSKTWITNNWKLSKSNKTISNLWLIYRLIQLTKKYPIIFKHIKSHLEEPSINSDNYNNWLGNDRADKLAGQASKDVSDLNENIKILKWPTFIAFLIDGIKKDNDIDLPYIDELDTFFKSIF